ncbi:MAG: precorrin-2 C(20)-methyltransferase [Sphaerochaetaceae bacterium]|nr:precorrin-2 C(20)-methyltransferase [Sphaerochaetaceae bacterium]
MHSLILGGYHSGKTERALALASKNKDTLTYISTKDIEDRIDSSIKTIKCTDNLYKTIDNLKGPLIIDDIASFYSNLVQEEFKNYDESIDNLAEIEESIRERRVSLIDSIKNYEDDIIMISSIVGLGLIPPTKSERLYRDELGFFNQELSKHCQRVEMVVAGITTTIKNNVLERSPDGKGTLYGVSVGPGDRDMIVPRATDVLNSVKMLAIPQTKDGRTIALDIISDIIDLNDKEIIKFYFPMTYDLKKCDDNYRSVAKNICEILDTGVDVAMPVLGDISIYSTFSNFAPYVESSGYTVKVIPGIPSFIAAADAFNLKLMKGSQTLTILSCKDPNLKEKLQRDGKKVIMKIGKQLPKLKALLTELNLQDSVHIALNVGMDDQRLETDLSLLSDDEGYLALILVDEK